MQLRYIVRGRSMMPTLHPGDRVLCLPWRRYRVGHIVIAQLDQTRGIKRISKLSDRGAWLVGDNKTQSTDSRELGWIPLSQLNGRVIYRYFPNTRVGWLLQTPPPTPPA